MPVRSVHVLMATPIRKHEQYPYVPPQPTPSVPPNSVPLPPPTGNLRKFRRTPLVAYSIDEKLSRFNERRNWCEVYDPVDIAMHMVGAVPIAGAFVLVYQMRKVRKQMNEYRLQVCMYILICRKHVILGTSSRWFVLQNTSGLLLFITQNNNVTAFAKYSCNSCLFMYVGNNFPYFNPI